MPAFIERTSLSVRPKVHSCCIICSFIKLYAILPARNFLSRKTLPSQLFFGANADVPLGLQTYRSAYEKGGHPLKEPSPRQFLLPSGRRTRKIIC